MISARKRLFAQAQRALTRKFGPLDAASSLIDFNFTTYYQKEMGKNSKRQFISFRRLVDAGRLAAVKIFTNKIENSMAQKGGRRRINLDPGYICLSKLVLATTKDFQHRIYLARGIYAEATLKYKKGKFEPYDWTYPDYKTKDYQAFFKNARDLYKQQLKEKGL